MTCFINQDMRAINLSKVSCEILFQLSFNAFHVACCEDGHRCQTFRWSSSHKSFMGLRSGLWGGHVMFSNTFSDCFCLSSLYIISSYALNHCLAGKWILSRLTLVRRAWIIAWKTTSDQNRSTTMFSNSNATRSLCTVHSTQVFLEICWLQHEFLGLLDVDSACW